MNQVLFLDFDGPLFPDRVIHFQNSVHDYPGPNGLHPYVTYWRMDDTSVKMLNELYRIHPFDTVVSSTWQYYHTKEQIQELFLANKLNLHLHSSWRTKDFAAERADRALQVTLWLEAHGFPDHMCLDDPGSGSALDYDLMYNQNSKLRNVFLINPDSGIDLQTYKGMNHVVSGWQTI